MLDDETDASAKAAVMVTMSGEFGELHQWDEAIRLCTNALERLAKVGDVVGIGRVYAHLSTYHLYNDDLKSAQDYRDRAVDIMTSNDDYYGAKDFLLTMFLAQSRVGGTDYWDNYEDVKQQEMVALGKEQGPMELSPIRMRLVSPRRAELGRCLPLLLLRRWLIDKKTPRRIRIFLGVLKNEGGKDSYHYLCILGDPGGQIQFESLTVEKSLRDSLPDGDHFLHVLFNEESLMRILVEPNPTNSHILEWEGDLYQLATVAKLLKEG